MERIIDIASPWIIELQDFLSGIQYTETLGYVLLIADAILSALFTEMLFKGDKIDKNDQIRRPRGIIVEQKKEKPYLKELILFLGVSILFFFLNICITLLLLWAFFHFVPQKESFDILLMRIYESYNAKFVVPLVATIIAGLALKGVSRNKRWARPLLCFLLAASAVASSFVFLWDTVEIIQRPHYTPPVESISAIINRRLKVYPFALSESTLRAIGCGSELITNLETVETEIYDSYDWEPEIYEEPENFTGYVNAISDGTYAPGKKLEDYLLSAYELFKEGKHGDDHFNIGCMWFNLYYYPEVLGNEPDVTVGECLDNALEYYKKQEEIEKSPPLYWNIALVYDVLDDKDQVRKYMKDALEFIYEEGNEDIYYGQRYVEQYIQYIYRWSEREQPIQIMYDADKVLEYTDDLSMYILYGACAIAENRDIMKAYEQLTKADAHYQGKSAMVKILCCICADMLNLNETSYLYEIYQLEQRVGLKPEEELYLIRYLFATDRFDELWGYIDDVGTKDVTEFSVEKAAIKAVWYFDSKNGLSQNTDDVEELLHCVDEKLEQNTLKAKERNLLLLSRSLLRNRLGEMEDVNEEEYDSGEMLEVEYVFAATNSFNNAEYDQAIRYCEIFFEEEIDTQKPVKIDSISSQELTPQEKLSLRYYMQLILAHAHYEYAQKYRKGSEEWKNHMDIAEKECAAFEQSSRSFFYIEERFEELKGIIHQERGEWPADKGDKVKIEDV